MYRKRIKWLVARPKKKKKNAACLNNYIHLDGAKLTKVVNSVFIVFHILDHDVQVSNKYMNI